MNIIELENVFHIYKNKHLEVDVLNNVSINFEKGKIYGVMGESGSGKSTLLNILGGIITPSKGNVLIEKENIAKMKEQDRTKVRMNKVGYIFQNFNLVNFLTVEDNIFLPLRMGKRDLKKYKNKYEILIRELDIEEKKNTYINELSGGQQQRVAIARCLLSEPKIILADEPTGNLDSKNSEKFMELIKKLVKKLDITFIMVTHSLEMAEVCDEVIKIKDGMII